jgi:hypothetical protein
MSDADVEQKEEDEVARKRLSGKLRTRAYR